MMGYKVDRRVGWDTHGLPVENEIEKKLGLKGKKEIEKMGIKEFNSACRESVFTYAKEWEKTLKRAGRWADYSNFYATLDNNYIESVWWVFKELWNKNLIYKDYRVSPYCFRCGTPLSNFEVAQGYKDVEDESVYIKFRVLNPSGYSLSANTYLLAWTTTPWTLPGNVALAINQKSTYVLAQKEKEYFILAKDRMNVLGDGFKKIKEFKGRDLVGIKYEALFNVPALQSTKSKNAFSVLPADFVSMEDGTGIVHTAVMYGADDFELGKKFDLPMKHTVDENGLFNKEVKEWEGRPWRASPLAGKPAKKSDPEIIKYLENAGLLFKKEKITHSYPFCWRCESPLLYYAIESWYVAVSKFKDQLAKNNKKIHWVPEHIKEGRFGNWLKEARDWAISRNRFWGAALPVWHCGECKKHFAVGSLKELAGLTDSSGNKYFILRHGEADSNKMDVASSYPEKLDIRLTARGRKQIEKASSELKKKKIDFIFSSDLRRTKETAEIISQKIKLPVKYDKRLRERDMGVFNGEPVEKFREFIGDKTNKFGKAPEKGENLSDVRKRMMDFVLELEKKHKNKNILIVGHGDPLWVLEGAAQGLDEKEILDLEKKYIQKGEIREIKVLNLPYDETGKMDLHRPYIDKLELKCPDCEKDLKRIEPVFDCWFESGSMPYGQWHYPFENKKAVEGSFPADFIAEGLDQTRGWFYTLHVLAGALTLKNQGLGKNNPAFKNVIVNGLVLSENGTKLSKRLRNYTEPEILFEKTGADALRHFLLSSTQLGEDYRFSDKAVEETKRKVVDRLMNSYNFFDLYADKNIKKKPEKPSNILDKWILARLNFAILKMTEKMKAYELTEASRELAEFLDDLSNWHIRRSRRRFQRIEDKKDYEQASGVLYFVLIEALKLGAPFIPFSTEAMFKQLTGKKSVHLEDWPRADKKAINKKLLENMSAAREIASLALAKRAEAQIKVKQPLLELRIKNKELSKEKEILETLAEEVNVKKIVYGAKIKETIELNLEITAELKAEGQLREFTRLVQGLRQEAGYKLGEAVNLYVEAGDFNTVISRHMDWIKREISAKSIEFKIPEKIDAKVETKIDFYSVSVAVKKQ
jgi:isoleucyl-tRNA synthetase